MRGRGDLPNSSLGGGKGGVHRTSKFVEEMTVCGGKKKKAELDSGKKLKKKAGAHHSSSPPHRGRGGKRGKEGKKC